MGSFFIYPSYCFKYIFLIARMNTTMILNSSSPSISSFFKDLTRRDVAWGILVFLGYFLTAKLGQFFFVQLHTSPAVIWPPVGIALAAMYLGGYRMWIPVALGQFCSMLSSTASPIAVVAATAAYVVQPAVSVYLMRRFGFHGSFEKGTDALILILVAFVLSAIGPGITTAAYALTGTLPATAFLTWGRSWAGGIFSIVVLVPFVTTWYPWQRVRSSRSEKLEIALSLLAVIAVDAFIFWTPYAGLLGIAVIFVLPVVLMWFVLRFAPRWLTLSIFLTAVIGIAGSMLIPSQTTTLSVQLFSDEVYIGFIAAIFLVFATIVEERRLAHRAIEKNNAVLEQALEKISGEDTAKTEFIAILAHELRNPLAPIVSAHEWLEIQQQEPESLAAIKSAQQHTLMIRRLLDDLLEMARVSQKAFKLQKETASVRDIVQQSIESTARFLQSRGHTLKVRLPEEDVFIFVDPVRIKQIVINLLNNAGKYTDPGGEIELTCERQGEFVSIRIKDNGVGIASAALPKIFDPFRRLGPTPHIGTGLGIGLSLTKRLVQMHDGTIEAESEGPGKGSTFTVRIPMRDAVPTAQTPGQPVKEKRALGRTRILIVDDNEAAAKGLEKLLVHHDQDVRSIYSGKNVLDAVASFAPDVILLDIGLPDIDGYEVARMLRAQGFSRSIVALTGYGQDSDRLRSLEAGFDYHLVKPVSVSNILAILGSIRQ